MNIIRIQQTDTQTIHTTTVQTPDDAIRFLTSTIKNSNPRLDSITYTYDLDNVQHTEEFYIDTPYVKYYLRPGDILQYYNNSAFYNDSERNVKNQNKLRETLWNLLKS